MEITLAIKIVGLILGLIASFFTITKLVFDIVILRKSRLKDEYLFAKEFFAELQSEQKLHPFVVEKGYHVISGDNSLTIKEIEHVLELENHSASLRDYVLAKDYLEYRDNSEKKIEFRRKFYSNSSRKLRKHILCHSLFCLSNDRTFSNYAFLIL